MVIMTAIFISSVRSLRCSSRSLRRTAPGERSAPSNEHYGQGRAFDRHRRGRGTAGTPLEEIAPLTVCLASEEAQFVTGQVVVINGGRDAPQRNPYAG
jgi:NAD(P)-dependent dehydrogenase (short-subunit alcohol dehydrogenase family)